MADALKKEFDDILEEAKQMYYRSDFQSLADIYTDDGMLMPPGMQVVTGRPAIRDLLAVMYSGVCRAVGTNDEATACGDDKAVVRGHFQVFDKEDKQMSGGKWLQFWKKIDGKWQLYIEMWNDN